MPVRGRTRRSPPAAATRCIAAVPIPLHESHSAAWCIPSSSAAATSAPAPHSPVPQLPLLHPGLHPPAGCDAEGGDAHESSGDEDEREPLSNRWSSKHDLPEPTAPQRTRINRFPKIPKWVSACRAWWAGRSVDRSAVGTAAWPQASRVAWGALQGGCNCCCCSLPSALPGPPSSALHCPHRSDRPVPLHFPSH